MDEKRTVRVTVVRYDPDGVSEKREETFEVPFSKGMTALMALQEIRKEHPISFRYSCACGLCDICLMRINGKTRLACKVILDEPTELYIEPLANKAVWRDLVTELGAR